MSILNNSISDYRIRANVRYNDLCLCGIYFSEINEKRRKREITEMTVIIGEDGKCENSPGHYCNGALKPGTDYR